MIAESLKDDKKPPVWARIRVPASTSNLGPGFDCLGLALAIYNTFTLQAHDDVAVDVTYSGWTPENGQVVNGGKNNMVWRAACEVARVAGRKLKGMRIAMELCAPLERGLGSSATAIIAGAVGANVLLGSPLSDDELLKHIVGFEGHPDNITASFYGGLTVSMLHRRTPYVARHKVSSDIRAVLAIPGYPLSTEKARAALPAEVQLTDAVHNLTRVPFVIHALKTGDLKCLAIAMEDKIHEPYRLALIRNSRAIRKAALSAGAAGVAISGAGPSLVAIATDKEAPAVAEAMNRQMKKGMVQIARIDRHGIRIMTRR